MDVTAFISRGDMVSYHGIFNSGSRTSSGFTMLELMISLAIFSVIFSLSIPSVRGVLTSTKISTNVNQIVGLLAYSRSEAIKRGRRITLCQTKDKISCDKTGIWNSGWMLFIDLNNNKYVDEEDTILAINNLIPAGIHVSFNGSGGRDGYIVYKPDGSAYPNGSFTICNPLYPEISKSLIMRLNGRLRISKKTSRGKAIKCTSTG